MEIVRKHLATLRRTEATKSAKRGGLDNPGDGGGTPPDGESASPNPERGKLCQASLHEMSAASLPDTLKPESTGKKRIEAPVEPIGVRGESAC